MMTTERTAIRRRLAIGRRAHRPPWGGRKAGHGSIVRAAGGHAGGDAGAGRGRRAGARRARAACARERRARERRFSASLEREPLGDGLRRMALGQLDLAIESLEGRRLRGPRRSSACTRRARRSSACARCCGCSSRRARRAGATRARAALLRDAGRRLARARDAEVLLSTLEDSIARHPKKLGRPPRRAAAARPPAQTSATAPARAGAGGQRRRARTCSPSCARCACACATWQLRRPAPDRARAAGARASIRPGPQPHAPRERARRARARKLHDGANASRTCATPRKCCSGETTASDRLRASGQAAAQAQQAGQAVSAVARARTSSANCSARSTTWRCWRSACGARQARRAASAHRAQRARKLLLKLIAQPAPELRKRALRDGERLYGRSPQASCAACRARAALAGRQPTLRIVSSRLPLGSATDAFSPGARPSSATATGDSADSRPSAGRGVVRADDPPGLLDAVLVAHEHGGAEADEPAGRRRASSTITAAAICSRSRAIFVSRCAWSFLASWYSLFSFRSPHSRAVLMRSAISRRPSPSSAASSPLQRLQALGGDHVARPSGIAREPTACRGRRSEVGARRRGQQRVDLHDRGLVEQLRRGRRAGDEQVVAQAQVLPGVVDVGLGDLRPRRIVRDRVQVQQVAEVDRREERVLFAEALRREVGERRPARSAAPGRGSRCCRWPGRAACRRRSSCPGCSSRSVWSTTPRGRMWSAYRLLGLQQAACAPSCRPFRRTAGTARLPVILYSCTASSAAGAVVTVLRSVFSMPLENGIPPGQRERGVGRDSRPSRRP